MATSFGKNFAIFRPTLVVDNIGVDVAKFDVCVQTQTQNLATNIIYK